MVGEEGVALPRRKAQKNMRQFGVLMDVGNDFSDSGGEDPSVAATRAERTLGAFSLCVLLTSYNTCEILNRKHWSGFCSFAYAVF